jgi:NitT/TauT family transport system permease protein
VTGKARRACRGAAGAVAVLGAAQLAVQAGGADQAVFPLPSTVLAAAAGMAGDGAFWSAAAATLGACGEAVAAAVAVAVPAGLLLGALPAAEQAVRPVLEFLRPVPSVVLLPLVLLAVQDTGKTQVLVIAFAAAWPVLLNTVYGVQEVDPLARQTLRSFGFGPVSVALLVSLPAAAPFTATGIRVAASVAFVVAVAAELTGAGLGGIGSYLIQAEAGTASITPLLAAAAWSGVLGIALNAVLAAADRRAFRWHHQLTASGGRP